MSKKILKRSLALGALMAFVITGSAMAADVTFDNEHTFGITNGNESADVKSDNYAVDGNLSVTTPNAAIYMQNNNSTMSVTAHSITLKSTEATAVLATYSGTDNSNNHLNVTATKGNLSITCVEGHGVAAANVKGSVTLSAFGTVSVNAAENAVYAHNEGAVVTIDAANVKIESTNTGEVKDSKGHAIYADSEDSSVNITATNSLTVTAVAGKNAVKADSNAKVSLTAGKDITIDGVVQGEDGKNSQIDLKGNNVTVTAKAEAPSETEGAVRNVSINATGKVTINADGAGLCGVGAGPDDATRAQAMNSIKAKEIDITSKGAFGVYANNHGYHTVGTRVHSYLEAETINIISKKDGIYASNGAVTEVKGFKTLNVTSEEQGIGSEYGHLTFDGGDVVVNSKEEGIRSKLGGELNFEVESLKVESGLESIKLTGDSVLNIKANTVQLDGDITTEKADDKKLVLTVAFNDAESYLNGKVTTVDGAQTNLTFNKGATWNVTGASKVSTLNSNEGKFVFTNDSHVDIDAGSGNINLTMADQTADELYTAEHLTSVAEKLGVSEAAKETITAKVVIAEGDVKGETTGVVTYETVAGADGYFHGLVAEETVTEKVNTKNQAIGEAGISLKLHWRAHMNDMNKRMGELRNANGEHGVWTRMVRGESEYEGAKAQYNQYQLGYDEKLSVDKRWTVGAAITFAEGDASYGNGTTEDKSTAFAIYGSKLNDDGTFVDLIARYARIESDLEDATSGKGDYSTNGMSVSAEFGKRIQQGNGLWIEPQVELTYGTVDSAEFQLGGKTVYVGDMDSLIGRVGFSLGKDIKQGNVYARASYLYDFDGETENAFSNATDSRTIAEDLGGGWWEVGVGANINLSKATYIYADVEKTFGGEVDTNWQWNLGVRYSF